MAGCETTAFWGMTINNYDETDLVMVQNGYPDHLREIVYTLEKGEEGTPHIQAWIKLQRQQRLSFVKKLFPRGHFKALMKDEYVLNTQRYAQKLDSTAMSAAIHTFNDPIHTIELVVKKVCIRMIEEYMEEPDLEYARSRSERSMVVEDYKLSKIFVSATYRQMWKTFGNQIYECVLKEHTHTHTHTDEILSHEGGITEDARDDSQEDCSQHSQGEDTEGDNFEESDSETDEGLSQSTGSCFDEEDD